MVAEPVPFNIDHVPSGVASVKAGVDEPEHTVAAPPAISDTTGAPITFRAADFTTLPQALFTVYLTVTLPALPPVTTPPCVIVAEPDPFSIDHTPSGVAFVNAGVF